MQIIFQDPFGSLDPRMTVEQVVTEPFVVHEKMSRAVRAQKASVVASVVNGLNGEALAPGGEGALLLAGCLFGLLFLDLTWLGSS